MVPLHFQGPNARWQVRRSSFRQKGVPHTLIVLSDVSRALREEERGAWQRLIRVLGHELNNSLTPIKSIAGTLRVLIANGSLHSDQPEDFERGLSIIESRAHSLNRFLQAYRRLAQMPPPIARKTELAPIVQRVAALEASLPVQVLPSPPVELTVDPDLLEQMLINLTRNAVEASLEPRHRTSRSKRCSSELIALPGAPRSRSMGTVGEGSGAHHRRQRSRTWQSRQCVCPVLYDQALRQRNRAGALAADR